MNDFVASLAHDLRNKINIVSSNIEFFEKKMNSGSLWPETKVYIEKSIHTLHSIGEFLEEMVCDQIDSNISIGDVIAKVMNDFQQTPIIINFEKIAGPTLTVNKTHIDRMISNIIQNAIEQNASSLNICLRLNSISFHDDGGGIDSEVLLKIRKGHKASSKGESRGLGLFGISELCERYHWTLDLQNRSRQDCHPNKMGLFIMISFPKAALHE